MKVGIIQSNYIPWRGYFDFIDDVDLFIFHDDLQYTKNDWRNRNKIKTKNGLIWLTVPVHYKKVSQLICHTPIDYSSNWIYKHLNLLSQWYKKSHYYEHYIDEITYILQLKPQTISDLNISFSKWILSKLNIDTELVLSQSLKAQGTKTERIINILKIVNATDYLSGPAAKSYLDLNLFIKEGINLEYKVYDYNPYPQLWGDYIDGVTILDLIFNMGPESRKYLKSNLPNISIT